MTALDRHRALLAKASATPWQWGDGWQGILPSMSTEGPEERGDKYLDLQLVGADGDEILPLRVDHYDYIIDHEEGAPAMRDADRKLLLAAVNSHPLLLDLWAAAKRRCDESPPAWWPEMRAILAKLEALQ